MDFPRSSEVYGHSDRSGTWPSHTALRRTGGLPRRSLRGTLDHESAELPPRLCKTLLPTNPIESMFSPVRLSERNLKRTRGSAMLQRWLGTTLSYCKSRFRKMKGHAEIARIMATIDTVHAEPL